MTASLRGRLFLALGALLMPALPLAAQQPAPPDAAAEPLILGVTNVGQAIAALRAQGTPVRHAIGVSRAVAVVGNPVTLSKLPFVRYVEPDPPDAAWIQEDTLPYGVHNIEAEVVWGGVTNATNVIPGHDGAGVNVFPFSWHTVCLCEGANA